MISKIEYFLPDLYSEDIAAILRDTLNRIYDHADIIISAVGDDMPNSLIGTVVTDDEYEETMVVRAIDMLLRMWEVEKLGYPA